MKRYLSALITILLLLLLLPGCAEEVPQGPITYAKPTFTPGVLESEILTSEPGNFDRISDTGNGDYLEIETGYYVNWWSNLYYAEKTDLNTWYYVCNEPDCKHHSFGCSSFINSNSVWYCDGRIYFSAPAEVFRHLFPKGTTAIALFSMEQNGEDVRLEHYYKEFYTGGGCGASDYTIPGGYVMGCYRLLPSGLYDRGVFLYTQDNGLMEIYREEITEKVNDQTTKIGQYALSICGDISVFSWFFTDDLSYTDVLCWFPNGEPVFTDISEIPAWGGYLQGSIIRCFDPGKGYYDIDLLTGERTKLADPQLENSKARILQPNCIIETTLLNPEAAVENQEMRFFDGQQWHAVKLPEELFVPDGTFEVLALSSDRVIFTLRQRHAWDNEKDTMVWYCMKLDGETYTVEPMGTFVKPYVGSMGEMNY